jgi:inner membrane protein import complex subunit Tim44-like protein
VPSWESCLVDSIDTCGRAYLGGFIGLAALVAGLWTFRDLLLDALSDLWPRLQTRLPRWWIAPEQAMPAVLVAGDMRSPAQVGRLWYGATLSGSDPPAADSQNAVQGLAAIAQHDPFFRQDALIAHARRAAPVVLGAWTEQDPRLSHRVMAPVIWEQQKEDLAAYQADGRRNVLEGLAVRDAAIVAAATDARSDTVVVRLTFAAADYDVAAATGALVRGSRIPIAWSEDWVFQRSPSSGHPPMAPGACPQCGFPIEVDVAGVCGRCDAELNGAPPDWLLSRIDVVLTGGLARAA